MPDPRKYFARDESVFDGDDAKLRDCRDEATAARIAEALTHLSA